ncbi:hypothetical protein ACB094_01G304300 [Castanea mollissima]
MEVTNRYITTKTHIDALALLVEPGSNVVIVKNLHVSIDPYQINRMKTPSKLSHHLILLYQVIDTYGVAKVVASGNPKFEKDDLVVGLITWGEYSVLKEGTILNKLDPMGFPLTYHVGILGFSGLAAYGGFFEVCKPKKGEKVFVSAASGSVGNMVEQYAKQLGCYVVGCAGTKQKVELLKEKLGFDDAFNYREETNLQSALKRYFPDGIDIYFDNVGGEMLGAAVDNALEDITSGVENIPSAFIGLFRGDNIGKKIVKLADE